ncbi:M48 family metallopeptidase [Marinomonas posidonica]|uniref:Peptidase M48 Ste24p n=1 Tax=Marinomonas posidonica (strain CECT 7376 / NCIMB 14433 / IVIA-Po-181) TaxID=491952 RepID=F6CV54_MARPP|nr:M48 family metallopeptidase [Marinomonas posidonica]AEF56474.1 peptidase M48 Ste24p [Marinomonas posidonica IVIA-Po-181]
MDQPLIFAGAFFLPRQSKAYAALLSCREKGVIYLECSEADISKEYQQGDFTLSPNIMGLPISFQFEDGSVFNPDISSKTALLEWSHSYRKGKWLEWIENRYKALVLCVITLPIIIASLYLYGPTLLSRVTTPFIPVSIDELVGDKTLFLLERVDLSESNLSKVMQNEIKKAWHDNLKKLNVPHQASFKLLFRRSEIFQNNAFTLSNRTIVMTDSLVKKMLSNQQAIQAVLLHETGHVIFRHNTRALMQSFYTTILTSLILNDLETLNESFIGLGTGVVNSAFSREMEKEADDFAIQSLKQLAGSSNGFIEAMQVLGEAHVRHHKETWFESLFSTHPPIQERIDMANEP